MRILPEGKQIINVFLSSYNRIYSGRKIREELQKCNIVLVPLAEYFSTQLLIQEDWRGRGRDKNK